MNSTEINIQIKFSQNSLEDEEEILILIYFIEDEVLEEAFIAINPTSLTYLSWSIVILLNILFLCVYTP